LLSLLRRGVACCCNEVEWVRVGRDRGHRACLLHESGKVGLVRGSSQEK